ncbi:5172_t:CDS:2, partial [Funneliformis geosporum]
GQIFALQNNLPHIGMAGYAPKRFSGRADEDIDEFIKDYRLYLTAANITTANAGGKQRALELFRSCMTDEASRWVEDKLIGKKWRLNHVRCGNALANMAAVVVLNNANITATMINAPDGTPVPALPGGATDATVIPTHNVHTDEDWSLAGGCLVDAGTATNAPNGALNNNNHIVLPDINIKQQELIFGTLTQGSDSVRNYYRKINKYANWARISDREKRIQFIRGLSPENKLEMKRLGLNRPLNDELIETLEEIETERNNLLLGEDIYNQPATKTKPKASSHQGITTEDVDRIVNSRIQALQQSAPNLSPVSSSGQKNITKADLQEAIAKSFQETMSRATKTLGNSKKSANKRAENLMIRRFLSDLMREKGNVAPGDDYNYDPVDDITDEETIRKVLHSELKLIFPPHFFQDSSLIVSETIVSQNDSSSSSNDLISDDKYVMRDVYGGVLIKTLAEISGKSELRMDLGWSWSDRFVLAEGAKAKGPSKDPEIG